MKFHIHLFADVCAPRSQKSTLIAIIVDAQLDVYSGERDPLPCSRLNVKRSQFIHCSVDGNSCVANADKAKPTLHPVFLVINIFSLFYSGFCELKDERKKSLASGSGASLLLLFSLSTLFKFFALLSLWFSISNCTLLFLLDSCSRSCSLMLIQHCHGLAGKRCAPTHVCSWI